MLRGFGGLAALLLQDEGTNDCPSEGLFVGQSDPGDALQIVKKGHARPAMEEGGEGFALPVADLEGEDAAGL